MRQGGLKFQPAQSPKTNTQSLVFFREVFRRGMEMVNTERRGTNRKAPTTVENDFRGSLQAIGDELTGNAKLMWDFVTDSVPATVLVKADSAMVQLMCETYARYRDASRGYDETGDWKDFCKMQGFSKQFREIASRMGMSPIDRAKLVKKSSGGGVESDPLAEMMRKRIGGE